MSLQFAQYQRRRSSELVGRFCSITMPTCWGRMSEPTASANYQLANWPIFCCCWLIRVSLGKLIEDGVLKQEGACIPNLRTVLGYAVCLLWPAC